MKHGCCYQCPDHSFDCRKGCVRAAEEAILRAILKSESNAQNRKDAVIHGYVAESSRRVRKAQAQKIFHRHP